jgi:hypothetical protein
MTAPMTRQKIYLPVEDLAAYESIGWCTEWRLNTLLGHPGKSFHVIKAASADDAYSRIVLHARDYNHSLGRLARDVARHAAMCIVSRPACPRFSSKLTVAR